MTRDSSAIGRSALLVTTGILLSRVLGLVRDVAFAHTWGTGLAMAAFVAAFTVPNLLRALFGEGAFSAAFVPVLARHLERHGKGAAWGAACRVISVLGAVLAAVVVVSVCLLLPFRGFFEGELPALTLRLLPWLLPYAVLVCVSGAFAGVLHTLGRFGVPAFSPCLLNLALIGGTFVLCPLFGDTPERRVFGLAAAVLAAGTAQVALHLAACRLQGLRFRFEPDVRSSDVHEVALLMAPALVGTGVVQLNVAVDRCLAVYLGSGATTSLYYSQRLVYLPVGLFGVAMGVVCLPAMARAWSRDDREDMLASFRYSLRHVFFLTLPATVLLALLGRGVIELLFQHGAFTAQSRAETLYALGFYLPGIPAFACTKIAVTAFHARRDTATPVRIACLCLALNVVLNLVLMQFLRQGGLALATTICSYVNVSLLFVTLRRELGPLGLTAMWPDLLRTCVASGAAAVGIFLGMAAVATWGGTPDPAPLVLLAVRVVVPAAAGGVSFLGGAALLRCAELREIITSLAGRVRRA